MKKTNRLRLKEVHTQNDEQEIRQLVATWMSATKSGDVKAVLELMADDVVFLVAGQPAMIGKSAFAAAAKAQASHGPVQFDGTSEIQEIKVFGEWAFLWTKLTVTVSPAGGREPMTRAGHTLSILRKQNGKLAPGARCEFALAGGKIR
ncbi:MAG TPA: SgcJ/EcaC family oxidoreductase [Candidatus Limnocylindrales bacterium]|nr:SgcJ/EcaC family oxidoreductase [Candidatus Limnocylindrales bacterium]